MNQHGKTAADSNLASEPPRQGDEPLESERNRACPQA